MTTMATPTTTVVATAATANVASATVAAAATLEAYSCKIYHIISLLRIFKSKIFVNFHHLFIEKKLLQFFTHKTY